MIEALIVLVLFALGAYVLSRVPMDATLRTVIVVVAALLLILYALRVLL